MPDEGRDDSRSHLNDQVWGPTPTESVRRAVMAMHWDSLTFVHWSYQPSIVQQLLPPGLTVQTFDGLAWISLVPFEMRVTVPGLGAPKWPCRFPETNVRTYVTAADGSQGIWFFSLDADRLSAVSAARLGYGLPYMWADMSVQRDGDVIEYQCQRRRPHRPATSSIHVRIGQPFDQHELSELDHFLSARWRLYGALGSRLVTARAVHEPWPLYRAELLRLDDQLVTASGLPSPVGEPIVQYAPSVRVRVSRPQLVRSPGR